MVTNICNTAAVMLTEYKKGPWKWSLNVIPKSLSYCLCWKQAYWTYHWFPALRHFFFMNFCPASASQLVLCCF